MKGSEVISELKKKFRARTDKALGEMLGLSIPAIHNWKKRPKCTLRQIAGLVHAASKAGAKNMRDNAVRPLVEFFRVHADESRRGARYSLFESRDEYGVHHPQLLGLKEELDSKNGVYLFFDSRGQAIYAGKAKEQSLWKEMNDALNRKRGDVQSIKRVQHPERRQAYRNSEEQARQIKDRPVPLWDLAIYFSAYEVAKEMINDVEALLVRSFANNLLNKRMERFTSHRT
jgi:hypothetical protein